MALPGMCSFAGNPGSVSIEIGAVHRLGDDQHRLDEIERALQRDDPKFATGQTIERIWRRRTLFGVGPVLLGMVLLVVG